MKVYSLSDEWTRVEIFFDAIPKDEKGNVKTVFLMNTTEGMYIRNIKLYQPGEERPADEPTYNPDWDYTADIKGTDYEFFIEPLGDDNSVKWDANLQAYHLINKVTVESNTRGFVFNKAYLQGIMNVTEGESISFEYKTDGKASGLNTKDKHIYQGYWPNWYVKGEFNSVAISENWTTVTINFADLPKDTDGSVKTIFLMNTTEGMYVRNIKVNVPTVDEPAVDEPADTYPSDDYLADIKGKDYEFFIQPLGADNSVSWDAEKEAYHLTNLVNAAGNTRGFIFDKEYLQKIMTETEAVSISFEYKTDGKPSGLDTKDKHIYQGYWPNWYVTGEFSSVALSEDWTEKTITFSDIPKDTDGSIKTIFLMNTIEGMYVRNIKVNVPDKDYLADIEGKDYEFFIQPLSAGNSVSWDAEKEAYHLTNLVNATSNTRGFIFDKEYLQKVITETEAVSISFEYKTDGKPSGLDTKDKHIYQGYWPDWYVKGEFSSVALSEDWTEKTITFSDIPKDTDGSIKTVFLMNTIEGMYVRNIKVNSKKEAINLADTNHTWSAGELYGSNGTGTFSRNDNIVKIAGCSCYASRAVKFADATTVYAKNLKIRFKMRATSAGNPASTSNLKIHFFNYKNKSGKFGTDEYAQYTFTAQDNWETVELDLGGFLDDNGHFTGFAFGMSNYGNHQTGERYTIEFDQIEIF